MKRYPEYKNQWIEGSGTVPSSWKVVKLKRATQFHYGQSLPSENRLDGDIPVYGSNGIVGYHSQSVSEKPCIIIGRKGSFGKVHFSHKECFPIDTTFYIDETATDNNIRWLYFLLLHLKLDSFSKDSAVPGINREELNENIVPLPAPSEQGTISKFLDHKTHLIDTLIEKKQKQIELLQEQRSAIINQAVTKGLNPNVKMKDSEIEWLGEVPEHWEITRVKFLSSIISKGTTPSTIGREISDTGDVRFLKAENIFNNKVLPRPEFYIDFETNESLKRSKLCEQDILFVIAGATIGKVAVLNKKLLPANTNQAVSFIRPIDSLYSGFLWYWLQSSKIQENIWVEAVQSAQPNISMEDLGNLPVPFPPESERQDIVEFLDKRASQIDRFIEKAEKEITAIQEYRTTLISEVVTGKIDVRDEVIQ